MCHSGVWGVMAGALGGVHLGRGCILGGCILGDSTVFNTNDTGYCFLFFFFFFLPNPPSPPLPYISPSLFLPHSLILTRYAQAIGLDHKPHSHTVRGSRTRLKTNARVYLFNKI